MHNDPRDEKRAHLTEAELVRMLVLHERFATGRGGARAILKHADLNGVVLANRRLDEADLTGASLVGASLYGSNLSRASLYCADLRKCDLRNAKLLQADMRGASFKGANLSQAVLDGADLRAARMMYVGSGTVSLLDRGEEGAFRGVDFSNCSLRNTSFCNAKLDGADFRGAMLMGTTFRGAKMTDARFQGAVLSGVNVSELKLPPEAFAGCVGDVSAKAVANVNVLKKKLEMHQSWISSEGKEGAAAVLDGEDLRLLHDQFTGRIFAGISARQVIAIALDFSGCQLQGARFDDADLRGANFTAANLSGVSFKGAKLTHARFEGARLGRLPLHGGSALLPNLTGAGVAPDQFEGAILEETLEAMGLRKGEEIEFH